MKPEYIIFRDIKYSTKTLLLHLALSDGPLKAAAVAKSLDMSIQGVLDYLHSMEEEGLIRLSERNGYLPTPKGIDMYINSLSSLRTFLNRGFASVGADNTMICIAAEDLDAGATVKLYVKNGIVVCSRDGPSDCAVGTVENTCLKGTGAIVKDIKGVIHINPGTLHIIFIETEIANGFKDRFSTYTKIGAYDTLAYSQLIQHDIMIDFIFAPAESCVDAALKGEKSALVAHKRDMAYVISEVDNMIRFRSAKLNYTVTSLEDI